MSRCRLPALLLAGCTALSGCVPGDERGNESAPPPAAPPPSDASAAPGADETLAGTPVSTEGMGPLRIGISVASLAPHLAAGTDTTALGECEYVRIRDAPDSVGFMVVAGRLARIDVRGGPTPTAEGARVGDAERRIQTLYPVLRRQPHKYTDGFYLIAFPEHAPDTLHRYVFETDGQRVTRYRAGVYPPVEYVEGCA